MHQYKQSSRWKCLLDTSIDNSVDTSIEHTFLPEDEPSCKIHKNKLKYCIIILKCTVQKNYKKSPEMSPRSVWYNCTGVS